MKTPKNEENKYFVIPRKYLEGIEQETINKITNHALKKGFNLKNKYYVCNQDEPYAHKIIETILEGEALKNN